MITAVAIQIKTNDQICFATIQWVLTTSVDCVHGSRKMERIKFILITYIHKEVILRISVQQSFECGKIYLPYRIRHAFDLLRIVYFSFTFVNESIF